MPRLNFDITPEQHRQLKTLAAYSGLSMKDFVLGQVFADNENNSKKSNPAEIKAANDALFKKSGIVKIANTNAQKAEEKEEEKPRAKTFLGLKLS